MIRFVCLSLDKPKMDDTLRFNYQQSPDTDKMSVSWIWPKSRVPNTDDILSIVEKLVGLNMLTKRLSHKDINDPKFCNLLKPEHSLLIKKYLHEINSGKGDFEILVEDKYNRYIIYTLCQILGYHYQTIAKTSFEKIHPLKDTHSRLFVTRKLGVRIFK